MYEAHLGKWVAVGMLLLALPLVGCGRQTGPTVIRLGHGLDPSHPVHKAMMYMNKRLREKSGGRMRLKIYPSEQLGTERQALELLQIGSLGMTKVSSSVLESFSPSYKALGLPYVFRGRAHRFAVLEGAVGQRILQSSTDVWLRGLTYYDAGSRSFYTRETPIRRPADLHGLKIRTQSSPVAIRMVNLLGGAATPLAFGELYSALQQGVVDGAENNAPSFQLTRHYELCKYYSLDEHTALPDVLLVSTHLWQRLSAQERAWLQAAADESTQYEKKLWAKASRKAMKVVRDAGVQIIHADKAAFREAVKPMYEQYRREAPQVYELMQSIKAVQASDSSRTDSSRTDSSRIDSSREVSHAARR